MSLFRPHIAAMAGYTPGEQPQEPGYIKLNTNENAYPPSPLALEAIRRAASERLRLYPDPMANRFREAAGKALGLPADWILATNGSDEALTLLARACAGEGDLIVAPAPSYPLYETLARIQGCRFEHRAFAANGRLAADLGKGAKLTLVPNPNSPTGSCAPASDFVACAEHAGGIVVCDEAYADFAEEHCLALPGRTERIVVTRSMSKGYSLAGIRFGFVVAQPQVIKTLEKIKDSYNVDAISAAAAAAAIEDQQYHKDCVRRIRATRARLAAALAALGFEVAPSQANFLWARRQAPVEPIYQALKERKILIRLLRYPEYGEGLRITVGTDAEVDRLLEELRKLV